MRLRHVVLLAVATVSVLSMNDTIGAQAPRSSNVPLIADGHMHIADRVYREGIDPWTVQPTGPIDYARGHASGLNIAFDDIGPYGYEDYDATVKQVGRLIETFHRVVETHPDKMGLALTANDALRIAASGRLAVILGIESGFDQDGDVDILRLWYRLGVRSIQFTSQMTTAYADAAGRGGEHWGGINAQGRALSAEMIRLGIVIDITHASEPAMRQIIAASSAPVVASHITVRGIKGSMAGVPMDIVQAVVAKGGVIGISASPGGLSARYAEWARDHPPERIGGLTLNDVLRPSLPLVRGRAPDYGEYMNAFDAEMIGRWRRFWSNPWQEDPQTAALVPTIDDWADYVAAMVAAIGPDHVAIGLDLFQGGSHLRDFDSGGYSRMAAALAARHVPAQVLGANWMRILNVVQAASKSSGRN